MADSDGYNPQTILKSSQPLMSPSWSVDARQVAYVTFENKAAQIYEQNVATGERRMLASFEGIDGCPGLVAGQPAHCPDPVTRRQCGDLCHGSGEQVIKATDQ